MQPLQAWTLTRSFLKHLVAVNSLWLWFGLGVGVAAPLALERVELGAAMLAQGQRQAGVVFQDGAQSIPVVGGTLWLFGDTFIGPPHSTQSTGMVGTTAAFLPTQQTNLPPALKYFVDQTGVAANPLALFADESAATHRPWPLGGITVGDRIYFYYSMIEKTAGPGPWNFRSVGGGLAMADKPLLPFVRLRPGGQWRFPVEPIQVVRAGKFLYLFEINREPKGLILARVPARQIETPAAYEFFAGKSWSAQRTNATVILREAYGQVSVVWQPDRRRYLLATSSDFSHPLELQLREAEHLTGPWSAPVRVPVPELPGKKTKLVYCTYLHPELSDPKARRWVATFCRILPGAWELTNPEWVTLTLAP